MVDKLSHPTRKTVSEDTCTRYQLNCQDVQFTTSDGITLKGWYLDRPDSNKAIIKMRGRNGTRSDAMPIDNNQKDYVEKVLAFFDRYLK